MLEKNSYPHKNHPVVNVKNHFIPFLLVIISAQLTLAQDHQLTLLEKSTNDPVHNAHISWKSLEGKSEKGFGITDENGSTMISGLAGSKVVVNISSVGYKTLQDTIDLHSTRTLHLEVDVLNLDQIVVTGTRTPRRLADVPVQTTVIPAVDIRKAGTVSPLEILKDNVPGLVTSSNAMGNNLRIRGLNSRYILFLVDGERMVSEGAGGNINLDQIDFNSIERVEVVNGAASALYGSNAVGAVINFITKAPANNLEGSINSSFQSHNTSKIQANVGSRLGQFTLGANMFRNSTDGYNIAGGSLSKPHTDYGTGMKMNLKPSDRIAFDVNGRFFQHEVFNFAGTMNVKHDLERKLTAGAKTTILSENNRNDLTASINFDKFFRYDVLELRNNFLEKQNDITHISGRVVNTHYASDQWDFVGGLEYNFESISTDSSRILGPLPTVKSVGDANVFMQWQGRFIKNLELVLGSRYTYNEQFGSAFSPKFSTMYKMGRFTMRGGIGTSFRAPDLKELHYNFNHNGSFWVYGNPDLVPERGLYNSLGVEFTKGSLNMSVSGYHNQIRDKITSYRIVSETGQPDRYYQNVSSATLQGIDVNASLVILSDFILKTTYSYCDAKDNNTGLQLTGNVNHSATLSLLWNGELMERPFSLQFSGRMTSPILQQYLEENANGNSLLSDLSSDPYNIWKVTFIKPIRIDEHLFEVTLKVDNLFNFSDIYFTNPGRQFLAGLRYKLN